LVLTKKRILVLGGGFAGVDCTRKLESYSHYDIEITLVSDRELDEVDDVW